MNGMVFVKTDKILIKNPYREKDKRKIHDINGTMGMNNEIIYPTIKGI
jgi:hypothetical protein